MQDAGTSGVQPRSLNVPTITATLLVILLVTITGTAIRIEAINAEAGGVLPRRDINLDTGVNTTWRWNPWGNEKRWLEKFGPRDENGQPLERDLTAAETAHMNKKISSIRLRNKLRRILSSWGLYQHLLVPAALVLSLALLRCREPPRWLRILCGAGVGISSIAGVLMIYRGYFSSLGW